jgi:glycosyltransferase involved in cell wall biosynthesis
MKLLLVAHIGYPWGGISQRYSDLLNSQLAQKVELTFFESSPNKKEFSTTGSFNLLNTIGFLDVCFKFIKVLLRVKPRIVHVASSFGFSFLKHSMIILIAKLYGCKVILAPHCSISVFIPRSRINLQWMKFILNLCNGMIVLSSEWLRITEIAPKTSIILLRNSINLEPYRTPPNVKKEPGETPRILYLGHIGAEKGIIDLIHAVNILKEKGKSGFEVRVYGEDSRPGSEDNAKELVKSLHIENNILFFKPIFGDKKVEALQRADIFVLPSYHEGLPISIIEAMAAGIPVIATQVGGIPDLIDDSINGILINPGAPQELADAMITMLDNKDLRHQYGVEAKKKAFQNHDVEAYVMRLLNFYDEIGR